MILSHNNNLYIENQTNVKPLDVTIVFLVFFTSIGWIVDAGTMIAKFVFFVALAFLCVYRIRQYGLIKINKSILILMLPVLLMICIGLFVHNRTEDLLLILKLSLAILLLITIPLAEFWKAIPKLLFILFPFITVGYALQLSGIYFEIPSMMLNPDKVHYVMTPAFTVFREGDFSRAYGPFWEPGVLAFIANISLISKMFIIKTDDKKRYWVEITILTIAQSAGGILTAVLIFGALFIKNRTIQLSVLISFFSIFTLLLALDFDTMRGFVANLGNLITLNFLNRDLLTDPSFAARIADLYAPFLLGLQSFTGFSSIDDFVWFAAFLRGHSAEIITNSFGSLAYFYGFSLMVLYLIVFSYSISRITPNNNLILIPLFVFMYFSNPLPSVLFTIFIILSSAQTTDVVEVRFG